MHLGVLSLRLGFAWVRVCLGFLLLLCSSWVVRLGIAFLELSIGSLRIIELGHQEEGLHGCGRLGVACGLLKARALPSKRCLQSLMGLLI